TGVVGFLFCVDDLLRLRVIPEMRELSHLLEVAGEISFLKIDLSQILVRMDKVGLRSRELREQGPCLFFLPGYGKNDSLVGEDGSRRGIELAGTFDFSQRVRIAPNLHEEGGIPMMSAGKGWVQFDGALELAVGGGRVKESPKSCECERVVGLGGIGIKFDSFAGGRAST